MSYDSNNIFARILRGEIPCNKLLETEHALAFHDIAPKAPVHVLVIPKGAYTCFAHFTSKASEAEIVDFYRTVDEAADKAGVADGGYRLISNCGANAHQEVPHYHMHILGGASLGSL